MHVHACTRLFSTTLFKTICFHEIVIVDVPEYLFNESSFSKVNNGKNNTTRTVPFNKLAVGWQQSSKEGIEERKEKRGIFKELILLATSRYCNR